MNDSIFTIRPPHSVGPADLQLPPTQPIDITDLIRAEAGR